MLLFSDNVFGGFLPTGPKSYRALGSYLHMISTVSDGYIATRIDVRYSTRTKYKYKYTL